MGGGGVGGGVGGGREPVRIGVGGVWEAGEGKGGMREF